MSVDFLDDLEAGELSVEFEGQEPWDLLEWAIERFGGGLAFSTAFQEGDVALIDMAYRIDPAVRVFSIDTGRLPQETHDLVEQLRERYDGLRLELLSPDARQVQRLVDRHGPESVLSLGREPAPVLQRPQGAAADARARRARRLGHGTAPRPVGFALGHPQDRDRPRPRGDREAESPRGMVGGRGLGLPARERRARRTRCTRRATRRSAACRAPGRWRRASPCGPGAGGGSRVRRRSAACTARSRPAASSTSSTRSSARARMSEGAVRTAPGEGVRLSEAEREWRSRRRVPCSTQPCSPEARTQLSALELAIETGVLDDDDAQSLERIVELALQAGRIRAVYGPPGEQAALRLYRKLPRGAALPKAPARSRKRCRRSAAARSRAPR